MTVRFCVACGHGLRAVRDGDRRRPRCPRCGWTFYDNPVPAAVAVIVRRGRVLLGRRARSPYAGTWDLPGGFLEADEAPEAGLRRELHEELGVRARGVRLIGFATDRYGPGGFPVLAIVYRVTPDGASFRAADDVSEARWFPVPAIPYRTVGFPSMRRLLRAYFREGGGRSRLTGTSRRAPARNS